MAIPAHAENRLARETSPYLLQHAGNPVDWYPWGPEAFEEARRRNVPIFLSVGYSTCYWCHVMERESFEDPATGALMSERFVCIKVDREERPDVDDIYMAAVQMMTRRGGWPMSVWLTPPGSRGADDRGLEPFYAGTYFPAEPRHGMPAFSDVLRNISSAWNDQREAVLDQAATVTAAVREHLSERSAPKRLGSDQVGRAVSDLLRLHDGQHGGFGAAPKFPQPVYLELLFEALDSIADPAVQVSVKRALRLTLDRMALGGMFDQVGGGFHRYSTDEKWLVPHFEKMLYDNGQLASLYARSFLAWGDEFDAAVLRRTLDYVLREMTSAEGAFYSAQDAEVNHREGQNYLWTKAQLNATLGEAEGGFAASVYGVDAGPNFRDPHHPGEPPANVLFLADRVGEADTARLARINARLYDARKQRDQPGLDDKIIVSWNGLMIAGMADGAAALKDRTYLQAARRASDFILERMRGEASASSKGGLYRTHRAGRSKTPAFLEDYAMLMHGLIALHRAGLALDERDTTSLASARELWSEARQRFADPERPGWLYDSMPGQSDLIVRTSGTFDGAMPSAPAVALNNLIDLYELTGERAYLNEAAEVLAALSHAVAESPVGAALATRGLLRLLRLDASLVAGIGAEHEPEIVRTPDAPVQVFSTEDRVVVSRDRAVELVIELHIAKGFHITAHEPGVEGVLPLRVGIGGGAGVKVEVTYPKGEPYAGAALAAEEHGRLLVHSGLLRLTLRIERTEEPWSGRPILNVTYQACDDEACFQPMTVELDVAIDPG
ncbi:MAG: DUF255 domain-containing protein [Phycisphaerae bacterium]|nr:DUF255 domain-containing protein [Phycisphaerae bacterium]